MMKQHNSLPQTADQALEWLADNVLPFVALFMVTALAVALLAALPRLAVTIANTISQVL